MILVLAVFLLDQGLDDADKIASVLSLFVAVLTSIVTVTTAYGGNRGDAQPEIPANFDAHGNRALSRAVDHSRTLRLAVVGVVVTGGVTLFYMLCPWDVRTPLAASVLFVLVLAAMWFIETWFLRRESPRRTERLQLGAAILCSLLLGLLFVILPQSSSIDSAVCRFGKLGVGKGPVYVRFQPLDDHRTATYSIIFRWGPVQNTQVLELNRERYFVMEKSDWRSPELTVAGAPSGYYTCGNGYPPFGSEQTRLIGWVARQS
ncbi:hypothetical protein [Actinoplanes sp. N902-109]|uniref:hypothetical protein n=1 Tax=Actinoplanes sp. (strain N902-109) TaxID=649831 RepID=UPI0003295CF9|nr:hypothetical protein [Actinoplanes sp. N902-109]AGL17922.1 hypothetical protein L083_4412 [Actinoplanes sp. N902-109]